MENQFARLEKHGIKNTGFVYWNLSTPLLTRRPSGAGRPAWPTWAPWWCVPASIPGGPQRQVCRAGALQEAKVWAGPGEQGHGTGALYLPAKPAAGLPPRERPLRPGLLRRGRPIVSTAHPGDHRDGLAQPLRPQHVIQAKAEELAEPTRPNSQ